MLSLQIKVTGMVETKDMLKRLHQVVRDMRPGFRETSEYLLHVFSVEAFESEGGIYGKPWAPLNPRYRLAKAKRYPGRGTLERTGKLRKGYRSRITPTELIIANSVEYGKYHQSGKGVPKRPLIALERRQKDEVERIIRTDIIKRLKGAI